MGLQRHIEITILSDPLSLNHRQFDCLFQHIFCLTTKKTPKMCFTGPVWVDSNKHRRFNSRSVNNRSFPLLRHHHHDDVIKWKHFPRYCSFVPVTGEFPAQRASNAEQPPPHPLKTCTYVTALSISPMVLTKLLWYKKIKLSLLVIDHYPKPSITRF